MAGTPDSPSLVQTRLTPRAVTRHEGVERPEAILGGGTTTLGGPGGPASLMLDFGEEIVGWFELSGLGEGAAKIEFIYGEDVAEASMIHNPFPAGHWYRNPRDAFEPAAGECTLRSPGRRAFRYVNILSHRPARFHARHAHAMLEHAAAEDRGAFSCSDPVLNGAWEISRRTIRLCRQDFFEDGVKRDGMLWIGDFRVEALCSCYLFGDSAMARRSLEMIARCQNPDGSLTAAAVRSGGHQCSKLDYLSGLAAPGGFLSRWTLDNYCADFVGAVWEHALHTGDTGLAADLRPAVVAVLGYLEGVEPGRSAAPATFITDNQPDLEDWWGSRSALAYQIAAAFGNGARLAGLAGDGDGAERWERLRLERLSAARAAFGPAAKGVCRDDLPADSGRSWHTHAAAYHAGGLTPAELRRCHRELDNPATRRPMAGFMEFWMLLAWLDAGLAKESLVEMRGYWGQMLRNGATTTWELVDRRIPGLDTLVVAGRSQCHGWSAGPAHLLPSRILGVTPTAPGFRGVAVRPMLGDLEWAEGTVPTPLGPIAVRLASSGDGEVTIPPGITATLHHPGAGPETVRGGATHRIRAAG
jgi:hypothetical protein